MHFLLKRIRCDNVFEHHDHIKSIDHIVWIDIGTDDGLTVLREHLRDDIGLDLRLDVERLHPRHQRDARATVLATRHF